MSGSALSMGERERLAHILDRLSSPCDGERAAAGLLAAKFVRQRGIGWADLLNPAPTVRIRNLPTEWRGRADALLGFADLLSPCEVGFLMNLAFLPHIGESQAARLEAIVQKVCKAAWARAA